MSNLNSHSSPGNQDVQVAFSEHESRWDQLVCALMPFDGEGGPTSVTLRDFSGWRNDGTLKNGMTRVISEYGYVLKFVSGLSQYVSIPNSPRINFPANSSYTFAIRFKTTTSSNQRLFEKRDTSSPNAGYYCYVASSGVFVWASDVGASAAALIGVSLVDDGKWHDVVIRINGEGGIGELFIDGKLDKTSADETFKLDFTSTIELRLGTRTEASGFFFDGQIGGFAIWKRPITDEELSEPFDFLLQEDEIINSKVPTPKMVVGTEEDLEERPITLKKETLNVY